MLKNSNIKRKNRSNKTENKNSNKSIKVKNNKINLIEKTFVDLERKEEKEFREVRKRRENNFSIYSLNHFFFLEEVYLGQFFHFVSYQEIDFTVVNRTVFFGAQL